MGVPTQGSYKMFDTGSEENLISSSIRGAQRYDALDNTIGNNTFQKSIEDAQVPLFDPAFSGDINSLSDISGSLQWRGYPQEVSCYKCSFVEVGDPSIKNITLSASLLDPQVEFNVTLGGTISSTNGYVTKQVSSGTSIIASVSNISNPPEQFVGFSFTPDGSTGITSSNTTYTHTVTDDITIYALAKLSDGIGVDFCYYNTSNLNTICGDCSTTKTVYFDRDDYATTPIEDLIWYENSSLTVKSDEGYYRRKTTRTYNWFFGITFTRTLVDDTIFFVSGSSYPTPGAANVYDTCGDFIYCNNS